MIDPQQLSRASFTKLAKLVAAFSEESVTDLILPPATDGQKRKFNLQRDALPPGARDRVQLRFNDLSALQKAAIQETMLEGISAAPSKDFSIEAFQRASPQEQISLRAAFEPKVFDTLSPWMDFNGIEIDELVAKSTNLNGNYLVLRLDAQDQIRAARMKVVFDAGMGLLPQFSTTRAAALGNKKRVRGVMFDAGAETYCIGKVDGTLGYRFSRLRRVVRRSTSKGLPAGDDGTRTDYYGIRLGHCVERDQPFAQIIYLYQAKDPQQECSVELNNLINDPKDPDAIKRRVQHFGEIEKWLKADRSDLMEGLKCRARSTPSET